MNQEEQKRLYVLNQVIEGTLIVRKAAELLNRSVRPVRRWIADYRRRGAVAMAHGNRAVNRLPTAVRNRIVKLARGRYAEFCYFSLRKETNGWRVELFGSVAISQVTC